MCEFISWIQGSETYFLTSEEINSAKGQLVLSTKDNDVLGHGAIKLYHDLKNMNGLKERENRNFWNGWLPTPIKEAWNSGKLDTMLKYMDGDDLRYILNNAPPKFSLWCLKQNLKKNNLEEILNELKKSLYANNRKIGFVSSKDWNNIKKDNWWNNRLIGYIITKDYDNMILDPDKNINFVGNSLKKGIMPKKGEDEDIALIRYMVEENYEGMIKDYNRDMRLIGYFLKQDYEKMIKDKENDIKLIGKLSTLNQEKFSKLKRPIIK